jgi:hypothetical protein
MNIHPVKAEFMVDRSDMAKLIVSLRSFANAPKMDPKYM